MLLFIDLSDLPSRTGAFAKLVCLELSFDARAAARRNYCAIEIYFSTVIPARHCEPSSHPSVRNFCVIERDYWIRRSNSGSRSTGGRRGLRNCLPLAPDLVTRNNLSRNFLSGRKLQEIDITVNKRYSKIDRGIVSLWKMTILSMFHGPSFYFHRVSIKRRRDVASPPPRWNFWISTGSKLRYIVPAGGYGPFEIRSAPCTRCRTWNIRQFHEPLRMEVHKSAARVFGVNPV